MAIGFNASYGIWLARAAREREHAAHVLRGIKVLDDRFANPAYGLLLVTGLAMAFVGGIPLLQTRWILSALILYAVLIIGGLVFYTPTLRKQIALAETGSFGPEYAALASRGRTVGIILAVIVLAIVFLMVVKPAV